MTSFNEIENNEIIFFFKFSSNKIVKIIIFLPFSAFGVIYLVRKNGGIDDARKYAMKSIQCNKKQGCDQNSLRNEIDVSVYNVMQYDADHITMQFGAKM